VVQVSIAGKERVEMLLLHASSYLPSFPPPIPHLLTLPSPPSSLSSLPPFLPAPRSCWACAMSRWSVRALTPRGGREGGREGRAGEEESGEGGGREGGRKEGKEQGAKQEDRETSNVCVHRQAGVQKMKMNGETKTTKRRE